MSLELCRGFMESLDLFRWEGRERWPCLGKIQSLVWKCVTTVRDPNEQILLSLTETEGHKIKNIRKAGLSKSKVLSTLYYIWQWANMNALGKCIIAKKMHSDTSSDCRYSLQLFVAWGLSKPKVLLYYVTLVDVSSLDLTILHWTHV